jgi:hypothetical protein
MQSSRRKLLMTATFAVLAVAGQVVQAAEPSPPSSGFYVNVGVAGRLFDTSASIAAGRFWLTPVRHSGATLTHGPWAA